jgi:hypothetical protein
MAACGGATHEAVAGADPVDVTVALQLVLMLENVTFQRK